MEITLACLKLFKTSPNYSQNPRQLIKDFTLEHIKKIILNPPQSLILEGGTEQSRQEASLVLASGLNCPEKLSDCPCDKFYVSCTVSLAIKERVHPDIFIFDGTMESIKIEEVRELRMLTGEPPRGDGKRVIIFWSAENFTLNAANALLKTLEEPRLQNIFILCTPQRERLFPTLVSRSHILTLPWPVTAAVKESQSEYENYAGIPEDSANILRALANFWTSGAGWFDRPEAREKINKELLLRVIQALSAELARAFYNLGNFEKAQEKTTANSIQAYFKRESNFQKLHYFNTLLSQAQEITLAGVNPSLVLDWLASRFAVN